MKEFNNNIIVQDGEAYLYLWIDKKKGIKYIGSHNGTKGLKYTGSGTIFKEVYKARPNDFERIILATGSHSDILELEEFVLTEINAAASPDYYNLINTTEGGATGYRWNEALREKMSKIHSERSKGGGNGRARRVYCKHLDREFDCIQDCADALGISRSQLSNQIHNRKRKSKKGGHYENIYGVVIR